MVDASGIPRRVTPETQAQKTNDLARQVQQLDSSRPLYPVWGAVYNTDRDQFNLTPALTELLSVPVEMPDGFTRALVQASADMNFLNTGTRASNSALIVKIDGVRPTLARSSGDAEPMSLTYVGCTFSHVVETTESFLVTCEGSSGSENWRSTGDEGVTLNVMVTFLR